MLYDRLTPLAGLMKWLLKNPGFFFIMNEPSSQSSCLSVSFEVKYWEYNTLMPLSRPPTLLAGRHRRVIITDDAGSCIVGDTRSNS